MIFLYDSLVILFINCQILFSFFQKIKSEIKSDYAAFNDLENQQDSNNKPFSKKKLIPEA